MVMFVKDGGGRGQTTKEAHVKLQRSLFLQPAGVRNNIVEDRSVWPKNGFFSILPWCRLSKKLLEMHIGQ